MLPITPLVHSVSDIAILSQNLGFHNSAMRKTEEDNDIADMGDLGEEYDGMWALIMDKGYQGAVEILRAILPRKKPCNGTLSGQDERGNERMPSYRIIVENVFWRQCTLWGLIGSKYRWAEKNYDLLFRFSAALTNMHIKWHPLRDEEGRAFRQYKNRLNSIGVNTAQKRKTAQTEYRARRKARLALNFSARQQHEEGGVAMLDLLHE